MNRDFKGIWIPKEIWLNSELSALDRVMLAEICSLDNENHCTANNEYFAEFCGVSVPTITRCIKKLKDMKFIETEMISSNTGSYRVIKMIRGCNQNDETGVIKMISNYNNDINTNNKVLSKDNTTKEFDFGVTEKPKKNLYQKCLDLINDYTDLPEIKNALISFLNYRLEIKDKPFYANQFKSMLKALDKAVQDTYAYNKNITYVDVIEYAIQRGWLNFYPIPQQGNYSKPTNPDTNKAQQKIANPEDMAKNEDGTLMTF